MKGSLTAHNNTTAGSTFTIRIPVHKKVSTKEVSTKKVLTSTTTSALLRLTDYVCLGQAKFLQQMVVQTLSAYGAERFEFTT